MTSDAEHPGPAPDAAVTPGGPKFSVVSVLPDLVLGGLGGVVGRAANRGLVQITPVNPRDFAVDKHRSVDDTPYGGGPGMVMKADVMAKAVQAACGLHATTPSQPTRVILLSPGGTTFDQACAARLARYEHVVLVCGRYEGLDERFIERYVDEQISLGDFVLSGGELGALCIIDAVARLVPGVLGDDASAEEESFSAGLLEYQHYTRPVDFEGQAPPAMLTSGNHAAIARWRLGQAMRRTMQRRPDLWRRRVPRPDEAKLLAEAGISLTQSRSYVALVHHPVIDKHGTLVTTTVTNLDLHDIARSCATYGLAGAFMVTPIAQQREKAEHIASMGLAAQGLEHRGTALRRVWPAADVAAAIAEITRREGQAPLVVATSANEASFPDAVRMGYAELLRQLAVEATRPLLLLFGTGWGLAANALPEVTALLPAIRGDASHPDWNHLSVRSAVAVTLDRLWGAGV